MITVRYYNNNACNKNEYFNIKSDIKLHQPPTLKTSKCWVPNNNFPEAELIFKSKDIIIQELKSILKSDKWGIWSSDYNSTPVFTQMTDQEITSRINSNAGRIGSVKEPSWRLYGLILNKNVLPTAEFCPSTVKLLQSSSNRILNAGFSVLEPGSYIGEHQDFNNKFYRLHIPLIIPKMNKKIKKSFVTKEKAKNLCVLQVENDYRAWKDDEYFIFDDTCMHNAWNPSDEIRIVLLVDLLKE
jgi:hypothetical protein